VRVTGMPECIKALNATTVALNPSWMDMALADDDDDDGLDPTQSKLPDMVRRLMSPSGRALRHPYGPALLDYAEHGCPVDTGPNWTREMLEAVGRAGEGIPNDPQPGKGHQSNGHTTPIRKQHHEQKPRPPGVNE